MPEHGNARGRGTAGAKDDTEAVAIVARDQSQLVRDLAARDDWRAAVAALLLPEREAHELHVEVLRARVFGAVERRAQRGTRRRRA